MLHQRHADAEDNPAHELAARRLGVQDAPAPNAPTHARHAHLAVTGSTCTSAKCAPKACIEYAAVLAAAAAELLIMPRLPRAAAVAGEQVGVGLAPRRIVGGLQAAVRRHHLLRREPVERRPGIAHGEVHELLAEPARGVVDGGAHARGGVRAARDGRGRHRESPSSTWTRSTGRPSASAATWVITVYVPPPRSCEPVWTSARPSAQQAHERGGREAVHGIGRRGHAPAYQPLAGAHRARRGSRRAQPKRSAPQPVALAERSCSTRAGPSRDRSRRSCAAAARSGRGPARRPARPCADSSANEPGASPGARIEVGDGRRSARTRR